MEDPVEIQTQAVLSNTATDVALAHRNLSDHSVELLAEALAEATATRVVDLQNNNITDRGAVALARALQTNTSVVELNLEKNRIGAEGATALLETLANNTTLSAVHLRLNDDVEEPLRRRVDFAAALNTQPPAVRVLLRKLAANDADTTVVLVEGADISLSLLKQVLAENTAVTELRLRGCAISDGGCGVVGEIAEASPCLEVLELNNEGITSHGCRHLLGGLAHCKTLRELRLPGNRISDDTPRGLSELLQTHDALKVIDLNDNAVSETGSAEMIFRLQLNHEPIEVKRCYYLAKANDPGLTAIDLHDVPNCGASAKILMPLMKTNNKVVEINLSNANVGDEGALLVAEALRGSKTIRRVELANNGITTEGACAIFSSLGPRSPLEELNLANNEMIGNDAALLATEVLQGNTSLRFINLELNDIDTELMESIEGMLLLNQQPHALKTALPIIEANGSEITAIDFSEYDGVMFHGDTSARVLAKGLERNTRVTSVTLAGNCVGDKGVVSIATLLERNDTITSLSLAECSVSDRGGLLLAEALAGNTGLTELNLSSTCVGERTGEALLDVLRGRNNTLTCIDVSRSRMGKATVHDLHVACAVNLQPLSLKYLLPRLRARDAKLTELSLATNTNEGTRRYNDAAVSILCSELAGNSDVVAIDLTNANFGTDGARALASWIAEPTTKLEALCVAGNTNFDNEAASELAVAITRTKSLLDLDVQDTGIGNNGLLAFAESLKSNDSVRSIQYTPKNPDVSMATTAELTRQLAMNNNVLILKPLLPRIVGNDPDLAVLNLRGDGTAYDGGVLNDTSMNLLALALNRNSTVTELDLSSNDITSHGVQFLTDMLEDNLTLTSLDLSNNRIDAEGVQELIRVISMNDTLRVVNMDENPAVPESTLRELEYVVRLNNGPLGLKRVVVALAENTDEEQELHFEASPDVVPFDDEAMHVLCSLLMDNTKVTALFLQNNEVTDVGAQLLADLLRTNTTIATVRLDGNRLTDEGVAAVLETLRTNHTLTSLTLKENAVSEEQLDAVDNVIAINAQPLRERGRHYLERPEVDEMSDTELFRGNDFLRDVEDQVIDDALPPTAYKPLPPKRVKKGQATSPAAARITAAPDPL